MRTDNLGINVTGRIDFFNNLAGKNNIVKNKTQTCNFPDKEIKKLTQVSEKDRIIDSVPLEKRVVTEEPFKLNKGITSENINKMLEKNTTTYVEELQDAFVDLTDDIESMKQRICSVDFKMIQNKLNDCKEALGGGEYVNNKRFFGISWEVCQANVRNAINHKWSPQFFWNLCAKYFGVEKSGGLYAHIQSTLNALKEVKDNITLYKQAYAENPKSAIELWQDRTGQMWHAEKNDPKTFLWVMNEASYLLEELLKNKNTQESLNVFKSAFSESNCCFPARQRCIQDYYSKNNPEIKLTEIVYEGVEKPDDYLDRIGDAIARDGGKYYNKFFANMSDTEQLETYRAAIDSEIKQLENQKNKRDSDRASVLKNIKDADIAKYIFAVNLGFDLGDLKVENDEVVFKDGSRCSLDELQ